MSEPPFDFAPPVDLDASGIVSQALRFMELPPLPRFSAEDELRPALVTAFDLAIDECLEASDWSFASTLAVLPVAEDPGPGDDTLPVTLSLPAACLAVRQFMPAGFGWRIDGRTLRTDAPGAVTIRYTARITREEMLPAAVKAAVSLTIAARLAARWSSGAAQPEELAASARDTLRRAMREDSRQASAARADDLPGLDHGVDWATEALA